MPTARYCANGDLNRVANAHQIAQNLHQVRSRIAEAAHRANRAPEEIGLVAVSKMSPVESVLAAWEAGQKDFGENRVEEAALKIPQVMQRLKGERPIWHMIGHIQRRKCRAVLDYFDIVHSVDRRSLAQKLSSLATEDGKSFPVLLECNVSGESSKFGYAVAGWEHDSGLLERFCAEVTIVAGLPGLRLEGLMTMAPIATDAETVRPVFASLRALRGVLKERFPDCPWTHLSMGMTDDFEVAVEEGATLLRIGRAIFGDPS